MNKRKKIRKIWTDKVSLSLTSLRRILKLYQSERKKIKECKHDLHSWSDMEGIKIYCRIPFCGYRVFIPKEKLDKMKFEEV